MRTERGVRRAVRALLFGLGLAVCSGTALAHGGSLGGSARQSVTVPDWLIVTTGGTVVGASFLLASFATDREFVAALHEPRGRLAVPWSRVLGWAGRIAGVVALVGVVAVGLFGPREALSNAAGLLVWAGWWAGYSMSTYLVGNSWPVVNPWRTIADVLPSPGTSIWRWGAWPSVVGLLALVWVEVVSPVADRPRVLAAVVLAYTVVTVAGALVYGTDVWFEHVDPVARVFRYYGLVAPIGSDADGTLSLRLPGAALKRDVIDGVDEVAFVVALLWVTTYDGLLTTPAWRWFSRATVGLGVPPMVLYPAALVAGFALFLGVYLLAARIARRTATTHVAAPDLARRFAPPLLAIAAGYHVAHFLGYFLSLSPALLATVTAPFSRIDPQVLVLPGWFGLVGIAGVLVGHLLAIWAAHAAAFDIFPGRLQAIRSQYPFIAAMVFYTMVSLWIVTRPELEPLYI